MFKLHWYARYLYPFGQLDSYLLTLTMANVPDPAPSSRKLVGQPLLYAISVFASLGVFLVRFPFFHTVLSNRHAHSLAMTKGKWCYLNHLFVALFTNLSQSHEWDYHRRPFHKLLWGSRCCINRDNGGRTWGWRFEYVSWHLSPICLHTRLIVTSMASGRIGDIFGRKGTLFVGAIVFTVGGAIQTFTSGFWVMIVGRVVSGFGVGLLSYVLLLSLAWHATDDGLNVC